MKRESFLKAVVWVALLLNSAQALQSPFDAIHEARKRNAQTQRQLTGTFAAAITGFCLIDTVTDTKIADLTNGTVFYVTTKTNSLSINASFAGSRIGSVKFGHNGNSNVHIENNAWYSFCGNLKKDFFNCSALGIGNHTVTATPYSESYTGGKAGTPYTVSFSIVANKTKVPAPTSAPKAKAPVSAFAPVPVAPASPVAPIAPIAPVAPVSPLSPFAPASPVAPVAPRAAPTWPGPPPRQNLPRFNLTALTPLIVNVTRGPVTVELRVSVEANQSSIAELYLEAFRGRPFESAYQISDFCSAPGVPVAGPLICNMSLTFPQYIHPGNYSLQLSGYSSNTFDYFVISSADLKNRRLPHVVEVFNKIVDTTPPQLLDLKARSPTTVNVTTRPASVDLVVVVKDDLSQLSYGFVAAVDSKGFRQEEAYFSASTFPYNNSAAGKPLTFNTSLYLSKYNRPGMYSLQVFLADTAGNTIEVDADSLAQRAFPSSITIINANYDGTPPVILKPIEISPTSVNVTLRPATIDIKLLVQDDISGVQSVYASLYNPASPGVFQQLSAYYDAEVPVAGKAVPISMSLVVPRYTRSGRYVLSLQVNDARGNTLSYNFDGDNKTSFVDIFNALEDVSPPKLLSLVALTPTTVNASSALRSVTYQVVVQDTISGIASVYLSASSSDGSSSIYDPNFFSGYQENPIAGQPAKFNISLEAKQSTKPGKYLLRLELSDAAGNYASLNAEKLAAMNAPSTIEVINPEYDGQPPELKDLVLLSSSKVNVSLAPAKIELQVLVQDDISGFKYGTVELYTPDIESSDGEVAPVQTARASGVLRRTSERISGTGNERDLSEGYIYSYMISNATFAAGKKVAGKAMAYNVSLTIPKFVMPGAYVLNINLFDFADNSAYFDPSVLSSLSFPSKIEVSNKIVDNEPPVLVSLTTRSPLVVDVTSGPVTVNFQAVALDALSGVQYGYGGISGPGESYDFFNSTEIKFDEPIAGKPVAFNISFTLEPNLRSGVYTLAVAVVDASFQYIELFSKDLISRGFPGNLTIVSSY
jgi:Bacterial Ig-like domain